jgi:cell division protein FtsB
MNKSTKQSNLVNIWKLHDKMQREKEEIEEVSNTMCWECHNLRESYCNLYDGKNNLKAEVEELKLELAVSLANQLKAMQEVEFWKAKAYEAEQFEGKHEAEAELRYQEVLRKANDDASEPIREMSDKLGLQLGECILQHGVPLLSESYEKAEAEVEELKLELSASKAEVEKLHEENKILNRQVAYLQSSYSEATCKWLKAQKIIDDSRLGAINLIKK